VRRGLLSLAAIVLTLPVLYGAATGRQSFEVSALRIVVLAVGVSVIDRYAAPMLSGVLRSLASGSATGRRE
jgi:energy-converting hydrogenase Eha subunit A